MILFYGCLELLLTDLAGPTGITPRRRPPPTGPPPVSSSAVTAGSAMLLRTAGLGRPLMLSEPQAHEAYPPLDLALGGLSARGCRLPVAPFERWATEEAPTPPGVPKPSERPSVPGVPAGSKKSGRKSTGRSRRC
uniref:Uncharacterized protein n=1 Tax=Haptolina brevifila TaxID=156173 RepID=A0A7S2IMC7_9EUKA|mmetsp:Transcript_68444/g.135609  ORF Transcript_68444/g.135609 Transcript_68444/m.135609 type:complete len:135 (+) Transcript_68444:469-873(+)